MVLGIEACVLHLCPYRLILVESRIHRLARYYKRVRKLPPNW